MNCVKWLLGIGLMVPLSGCSLLEVPEPELLPVKPVPPKGPIFDPADGMKPLLGGAAVEPIKLNTPGVAGGVDYFNAAQINVTSDGEPILVVQTRGLDKAGKAIVGNNSNPVRLAGILIPAPGKPGADSSLHTLQGWTLGQKLDMEQDRVFPLDLSGRPRVQAFFVGRGGKYKDQKLNLNRLMVRSGYAVVDLYEATTFDTQTWLKDEQFARDTRAGLWQNPTFSIARRKPVKPRGGKGQPGNQQGGKNGKGPRGMKLNTQNTPNPQGNPSGLGSPGNQGGPGAQGGPNGKKRGRNRGKNRKGGGPQGAPQVAPPTALAPVPPAP